MIRPILNIDFEYSSSKEEFMNVVCCAVYDTVTKLKHVWWTNNNNREEINKLEDFLKYKKEGNYIFIAHSVEAEASALLSLVIDPLQFDWIDTFKEFRMLTNHNDGFKYGKHLDKGKVKTYRKPRPKWARSEGETGGGVLTHNLSQTTFKLLGTKIDTEHKDEMRKLIISAPDSYTEKEKEDIMEYCISDTLHLHRLYKRMAAEFKKILSVEHFSTLLKDMLWRGETGVRTAMMERKGYPIDHEKVKNFSLSTTNILSEIQKDINSQFPDIHPFWLDKKSRRFTQKKKPINEFIESLDLEDKWLKTDKGALSHKLEAFTKHFPFRHSYPRDNFGAQMVRYLHTKQNLNGFVPAKTKSTRKKFKDYLGKDNVVRPYLNAYGSQSARYQPSATGFIFLKAAWMRGLVHPPVGKMIVGIDDKSQEFYLSALMSGDKEMIKAYLTGDVYLAFGKAARGIPEKGTKQTYPKERQAFKSSVLGISYGMTKVGLAKKLSLDLGRVVEESEAQEYIDLFEETYEELSDYKDRLLEDYEDNKYIRLADGWVMFGDNDNERSVLNCPIQGMGSCILRKAIQLTQDKGIQVLFPLHDAAYIMVDLNDWKAVSTFADCMQEAFKFFFPDALPIGLDCEAWGTGLEEGTVKLNNIKVSTEGVHIDERSKEEYDKFSKYFESPDSELL